MNNKLRTRCEPKDVATDPGHPQGKRTGGSLHVSSGFNGKSPALVFPTRWEVQVDDLAVDGDLEDDWGVEDEEEDEDEDPGFFFLSSWTGHFSGFHFSGRPKVGLLFWGHLGKCLTGRV